MDPVVLNAHFDGEHICLDDEFPLSPDSKLLVTVLNNGKPDTESADLLRLSREGLARAFGDEEPEYSDEMIKRRNPDYERA
jgi:hypothetical protein